MKDKSFLQNRVVSDYTGITVIHLQSYNASNSGGLAKPAHLDYIARPCLKREEGRDGGLDKWLSSKEHTPGMVVHTLILALGKQGT